MRKLTMEKRRRRRILFRKGIVLASALGLLLTIVLLVRGCFYLMGQDESTQPSDWEYAKTAEKYAQEYHIPLSVVYAVVETESAFDPQAESRVGACGLMQLMPDTYDWILGKLGAPSADEEDGAEGNAEELVAPETPVEGIFDPETNLRCGIYYLSYLYDRFGVWETVYAGYNAGPNIVAKWLEDARYSSDGRTLETIPYTETANYVVKVSEARTRYQTLFETE